uniref:Uncharacterized protein n=1 Tax=Xenopus tropicalis TaxID=8364 RepID=A0A803K7W2_XENTR
MCNAFFSLTFFPIFTGAMHVGDCPREPNIPIYLIVAGAFHLLAFCLIPLKKPAEKVAYVLESIIGLFLFCWFITEYCLCVPYSACPMLPLCAIIYLPYVVCMCHTLPALCRLCVPYSACPTLCVCAIL